jgi:hypothetical protein
LSVEPEQTGLGDALAVTDVGGVAVTVTEVVAAFVVPHTLVACTVYTPAAAAVAVRLGFCTAAV